MKIMGISDLHGKLPDYSIYNSDVCCICGDIIPLLIQKNIKESIHWINSEFIPWCESLKCDNVILIAGNHDFIFEKLSKSEIIDLFIDTKIIYLSNESIIIDGVKFYGTPYCHEFGNWAFMKNNEELEKLFNFPNDVDILLTHDAPYGVSDICREHTMWEIEHKHLGNFPLEKEIIKTNPKINLHGHFHSSNHFKEMLNNTEVYNVSILDESYDVTYLPYVFIYNNQ